MGTKMLTQPAQLKMNFLSSDAGGPDLHTHFSSGRDADGRRPDSFRYHHGFEPEHRVVHPACRERAVHRLRHRRNEHRPHHPASPPAFYHHAGLSAPHHLHPRNQPFSPPPLRLLRGPLLFKGLSLSVSWIHKFFGGNSVDISI